MILRSNNVEETINIGKEIAALLNPNDMLVLTGDLGAGKTHFTKGIAEAFGISDVITSPTFPIVVEYSGNNLQLLHFDLYRLEEAQQLEDIAWYELIESGAVCIVEWGDKFPQELPDDYLELHFSVCDDGSREINLHPHGAHLEEIVAELTSCTHYRCAK